MNRNNIITDFLMAFLLLASCKLSAESKKTHASSAPDVFYIISTNVLHAYDKDGKEIYNSRLAPADTLTFHAEREYVRKHYAEGMRFYAPYYEQCTFAGFQLSTDSFAIAYAHAKADITRSFREYMEKENKGRDVVIIGFSQGAMLALDLLKEMPEKYYKRCRSVYMLGYRLTTEDMAHKRVTAAADSIKGNVVSFNSVMRRDATWDAVAAGAATCINPLNWRTDSIAATLTYKGDTATVRVDSQTHQLLVSGLDESKYTFPLTKPGNLHHWDLIFYAPQIHRNIQQRCR